MPPADRPLVAHEVAQFGPAAIHARTAKAEQSRAAGDKGLGKAGGVARGDDKDVGVAAGFAGAKTEAAGDVRRPIDDIPGRLRFQVGHTDAYSVLPAGQTAATREAATSST